jgi:hypothetical protein
MNKEFLTVAATLAATICATASAAGPMDAFKGKMKEGLYEYKMSMEMPGMPAGMGNRTFQNCVTQKELDEGKYGKGRDKAAENCEMKDVNVSGNTASYKMVCKGEKGGHDMVADTKVTYAGEAFIMDMKMSMNEGGKTMNVNQHMEGRRVGPCTK